MVNSLGEKFKPFFCTIISSALILRRFVIFAKRIDITEARLRVFCMTDDKEEKTLEGTYIGMNIICTVCSSATS